MSKIGKQAPYLDGVPVVVSTALRDAMFPSPDTNQRVQNLETRWIERHDGAEWQQEFAGDLVGIKRTIWKYATSGVIDADAIQDAVDDCDAGDTVEFGRVQVTYDTTIHVRTRSITFEFAGMEQCGLSFTGTGAGIELGDDDGLNWDAGNYNGTASHFAYIGGYLRYTGTTTTLANGLAGYGAGTYAIRDWRGGNIRIENTKLSNWDYWFWGVQSDLNHFRNLILSSNHSGCLLGPRSDQFTAEHVWSFLNDTVWQFEGVRSATVVHWASDGDGSATTNPVICRNSTPSVNARYGSTRVVTAIVFDTPWLEASTGGSTAFDVTAFFEIGTAETTQAGALIIRNPFVVVNFYSTPSVQHTLYLVLADNCTSVVVEGLMGVSGVPWTNLRAVVKVANAGAATNTPAIWFSEYDQLGGRVAENFSVTTVPWHFLSYDATVAYQFNSVGGTGNIKKYGGPDFRRILSGSVTWDPASTANGALSTGTTCTVTGAALGNGASASFSIALPAGCFLVASVTSSNTVTVQLANFSGSVQDLSSGTLTVYVTQHPFQ